MEQSLNFFMGIIARINVPRLQRHAMQEFGWMPTFASDCMYEYVRFLELKLLANDYDAMILSPSETVDKMWHLHILDTRAYAAINSSIATALIQPSKLLHHYPCGALDAAGRAVRYQATLDAYTKKYGQAPPVAFWPAPVPTAVAVAVAAPAPAKKRPAPKRAFPMQTFIKMLDGVTKTIAPRAGDTIDHVKLLIHEHVPDIAPDRMRLIWSGRQLEDGRTLADYDINNDSTIHLLLRLAGC